MTKQPFLRTRSAAVLWCAQAVFTAAVLSCSPGVNEISRPPETPPLSRDAIGYGVITVPYTRVMSAPGPDGVSLGFVRERAVLKASERRLFRFGEEDEYWVHIEEPYAGWIPGSVVVLYDSAAQAATAASVPARP